MEPQEFAAKRQERLLAADEEIRRFVRDALSAWDGEGEFHSVELEEAVEVIWLEHFAAEAPRADYERFLPRFRQILTQSLAQTSATSAGEPADYEVNRVTTFLGALAVNDGTFRGTGARGGKFKRWTSMHDPSVRHAHTLVDGQVRAINEPFTVEGVDLQYPGQPIGDPSVWINCRCVMQPAAARGEANVSDTTMTLSDDFDSRSRSLTAAADVETEDTGVGIFLIPAETDPIVAASSEEPAHMTTIWMGKVDDLDVDTAEHPMIDRDTLMQEVRQYAAELTPITVPVSEKGQGELGDEGAMVVFLEPTDSLLALRDGLLAEEQVGSAHARVEQFPEWTPHVTLGYPESPARGEYDGDAVTFDRLGLWIGPNQYVFPMGEPVSKGLAAGGIIQPGKMPLVGDVDGSPAYVVPLNVLADAGISAERWERALRAAAAKQIVEGEVEDPELDDEMPADELEEGEEEILEIPVHGVATVEGKPTGDGRGFRPGAISFGRLPAPLGYEFESGHGSDNSRVAIVGRIDEFFTVPAPNEGPGVFEVRWRGAIMPGKEYGARAIESIIDGSYDGNSVVVDSVTVDVTEEREAFRKQFVAERDAALAAKDVAEVDGKPQAMSDEEIEAMVDAFIGDGKTPTTWFSEARVRRFDMVPTGAFQEGYVRLGHEFEDELTDEQLTASAAALDDCGCRTRLVASAAVAGTEERSWTIVDLTELTEQELAAYELMDIDEQRAFAEERGLIESFAPGTKDGPGWITHPTATARIRRYWVRGKGAAKIAWGTPGDFNRCRNQLAKYVQNPEWLAGLCANMHKEATGTWPGIKRGDKGHSLQASAAPIVRMAEAPAPLVLQASAGGGVFPASAFAAPTEGRAFAMRVNKAARTIQGYAAQWGTCHIGITGVCQDPPYSSTDYSYFRKGTVDTDAGEQRVALITYGIGHASEFASAAAATAHYDQTDAVRCYINIGEDEHGIWYSGVFAPFVTEAQMDEMRAIGRVSGDWRTPSGRPGDYEMVGLVCVNTEGFQLAASAAIGIGALAKGQGDEPVVLDGKTISLTRDDIAGIALAAAEQVYELQHQEHRAATARAELAAARNAIGTLTLAAARRELATLTKD